MVTASFASRVKCAAATFPRAASYPYGREFFIAQKPHALSLEKRLELARWDRELADEFYGAEMSSIDKVICWGFGILAFFFYTGLDWLLWMTFLPLD